MDRIKPKSHQLANKIIILTQLKLNQPRISFVLSKIILSKGNKWNDSNCHKKSNSIYNLFPFFDHFTKSG